MRWLKKSSMRCPEATSTTRLEQQRDRRPEVAGLLEADPWQPPEAESGRPVQRVHRVRLMETVGEASGVGEQVPYPHRLRRRDSDRSPVGPGGVDAHIGEGRDVGGYRVGELERALLVQHHRRDRSEGLGHRVQPPHRVGLDR
jgi:hypothetical protein